MQAKKSLPIRRPLVKATPEGPRSGRTCAPETPGGAGLWRARASRRSAQGAASASPSAQGGACALSACVRPGKGVGGPEESLAGWPRRAAWEPAPSGRWFICLWAVPLCPALLRSPGVCSLPWPRQRVSRVVVAAIAVMEAFPTAAPSPGKQVQEPRRGHRQEAGGPERVLAHFVDPGSWALFC